MKNVVTVEESKAGEFEDMCNALIEDGYKMVASSCGFVNSENYDFCGSWMAVMVKEVAG